ncbi:MAG: type III pantothenate kinase, partial [Burkholderiales bacterium]
MILVIDCGNSRIKWGYCAPLADSLRTQVEWIACGASDITQAHLISTQWRFDEKPSAILVSNVAGPVVADTLAPQLSALGAPVRWVRAVAEEAGVVNRYTDPDQLGADRWAA